MFIQLFYIFENFSSLNLHHIRGQTKIEAGVTHLNILASTRLNLILVSVITGAGSCPNSNISSSIINVASKPPIQGGRN